MFFFKFFFFFFFNDTATTEIYTLSLHDALPIAPRCAPPPLRHGRRRSAFAHGGVRQDSHRGVGHGQTGCVRRRRGNPRPDPARRERNPDPTSPARGGSGRRHRFSPQRPEPSGSPGAGGPCLGGRSVLGGAPCGSDYGHIRGIGGRSHRTPGPDATGILKPHAQVAGWLPAEGADLTEPMRIVAGTSIPCSARR